MCADQTKTKKLNSDNQSAAPYGKVKGLKQMPLMTWTVVSILCTSVGTFGRNFFSCNSIGFDDWIPIGMLSHLVDHRGVIQVKAFKV